ncbi:ZNF71 factor, partial [Dryoscopus gambensis]|nr:ZNF71 factor [Dryoscopus gambensis]
LTRHQESHTWEKPYKCGNCGESFSRKCNLTLHMMRHTGEQSYKCGECRDSFSTWLDLMRHLPPAHPHWGEALQVWGM